MPQTQAALDAEINELLLSGGGITAATLRQVLHDMNAGVFQDGITGFATPSSPVALTASPGISTNALRSDATLAISQAIAPTWTAPHIFANLTPSVSSVTGAVIVSGGVGIAGALNIGSTLNAAGTIYVASAPVQIAQRVTGSTSGTVATSTYSLSILTGSTVLAVRTYTTTAFLATGSVMLTAGTVAGDSAYIAGQNVKNLGIVNLNLNGSTAQSMSSMPSSASPNFFVTLTQTGTPSAVGSVLIVVEYLQT